MLAEVDVPNPDLALSTGMTAETTIILQKQKNVLTVPAGAVLKEGDGQAYVLIVDADNKVQKVTVALGIQGSNRVEITQGLKERQSVIVSGQSNYETGQIVRPKLSTISMPAEGDD
jgi:multidrug efflux pump subunit AcrA (membrane-fusion protein)